MSSKPKVYLAGPIQDCNRREANDWRDDVTFSLRQHNIIGISPLRCEPLIGETYNGGNADPRFGTARAIASKNFFDVANCDMVLAYMPRNLEKSTLSIGTILEIGWAFGLRKPVVLVTDDERLVKHPVMNSNVAWLLPTLEDGVDVVLGILGDYANG